MKTNQVESPADMATDTHLPHPVGTGVGAVAGAAIAGAAVGTVAGPVGTVIGAAIGAIAGGFAGNALAETAHPHEEGVMPASYGSHTFSFATAGDDSADQAVVLPDHDAVARRAYGIWETKGRSDGHAIDDWLQAESLLKRAG